jgi:amino acid permease
VISLELKQVHTSSSLDFLLSVTTIMKTVIGAGILSLPLTVSRLGYVLSLIVFVIVISIIQFSAVLLLKAKNLSKHSNYASIAYHIFRTKFAQILCSVMILLNNTGICIAELLIIKGAVGKILDGYV